MALLERPDGTGTSRTKLTALAAMAYPLIEPHLNTGALDPETVRRFAPYVLLGLGLYYLRAAIKGNPPNLDALLESYRGIHARLERVQRERDEYRKLAQERNAERWRPPEQRLDQNDHPQPDEVPLE